MLKGVALGLIGLPNPDRVISADDPSAEPVDEAQLAIDAMTELRLVLEVRILSFVLFWDGRAY